MIKKYFSKGLVDVVFTITMIVVSVYAYNEYKIFNTKVYIVDVQKIYQLKQATLSVSTASEDDVTKYYDSLEKLIVFSNAYINGISKQKATLVYPKTHVLTTKSNQIIDLTDELIGRLKEKKLLP